MDMESLKIFVDVQRSGSITAAAKDHYMTQPALGKRIAQLEAELGITLFQRGKGQSRVQLTPAGETFLDIAERMLILYEQSMQLRHEKIRQFLTVASIRSAHDSLVPNVLNVLMERYPDLCVTVEERHNAEILSMLEKRHIDIGITLSEPDPKILKGKLLYEESYRAVFRKGNQKFSGSEIHPSELQAEHGIFQVFDHHFDEWFNHWWNPYMIKVKVNSTPTAESYINHPDDWVIVPESVSYNMEQRGFISYALLGSPPRRHVFIAYNPKSRQEGIQIFFKAAEEYISNMALSKS